MLVVLAFSCCFVCFVFWWILLFDILLVACLLGCWTSDLLFMCPFVIWVASVVLSLLVLL